MWGVEIFLNAGNQFGHTGEISATLVRAEDDEVEVK